MTADLLLRCVQGDDGAREQEGVEMQQDFDGDVGDVPPDDDRDSADNDAEVRATASLVL